MISIGDWGSGAPPPRAGTAALAQAPPPLGLRAGAATLARALSAVTGTLRGGCRPRASTGTSWGCWDIAQASQHSRAAASTSPTGPRRPPPGRSHTSSLHARPGRHGRCATRRSGCCSPRRRWIEWGAPARRDLPGPSGTSRTGPARRLLCSSPRRNTSLQDAGHREARMQARRREARVQAAVEAKRRLAVVELACRLAAELDRMLANA